MKSLSCFLPFLPFCRFYKWYKNLYLLLVTEMLLIARKKFYLILYALNGRIFNCKAITDRRGR